MRNKTLTSPLAILSLALLTGTLACDIDSTKSQERGVLLMKLTDAPIDDVEKVFVTFSEVAVQRCVDSEQEAQEQSKAKQAEQKDRPAKGKSADEVSQGNEGDDRPGLSDNEGDDSDDDEGAQETRSELGLDSFYSDEQAEDEAQEQDGEDEDGEDEGDQEEDEKGEKKGSCEFGVWEVLELGEQTKFDLLTLQDGKTADLGMATLPSGTYGQIRIKLDAAEIVVKGETVPLKVPSGMQSGLKIVGGFEVAQGKQTEITVDFDAGLSLKYIEAQGWMMKPVIRLLK